MAKSNESPYLFVPGDRITVLRKSELDDGDSTKIGKINRVPARVGEYVQAVRGLIIT